MWATSSKAPVVTNFPGKRATYPERGPSAPDAIIGATFGLHFGFYGVMSIKLWNQAATADGLVDRAAIFIAALFRVRKGPHPRSPLDLLVHPLGQIRRPQVLVVIARQPIEVQRLAHVLLSPVRHPRSSAAPSGSGRRPCAAGSRARCAASARGSAPSRLGSASLAQRLLQPVVIIGDDYLSDRLACMRTGARAP